MGILILGRARKASTSLLGNALLLPSATTPMDSRRLHGASRLSHEDSKLAAGKGGRAHSMACGAK
jgi:hypothetical protein